MHWHLCGAHSAQHGSMVPGDGWQGCGGVLCESPHLGWLPAALLAQNLNSDDQDVVLRALKRMPEGRLKKEGLKALSLLLVEGNSKVVSAVSAQLRSLAENPRFRQRVRAGQARDDVGWCHSPQGAACPCSATDGGTDSPISPRPSCVSWSSWRMRRCRYVWQGVRRWAA